jgi:tetratricopeptide (TPR) repeat protein
VDAVPAESWVHRWAQASLAGVLHRAYHATGDRDTLDEAVAAARATLAATPLDHTERPGTLLGLSALLQTRYGAYRAKEDLTEANALVATALSATTQGWFLSADLLERYNQGILQQYDFTGDQEPLLRAVELLEQLLPGAPSYARPHLAVALGATLATLANATESVSLLDRAIAAFETTLGEDPSKALMVPSQLAGLGMARFSRFCHTNDLADLDRAVVDLIRASQALSSADPRRVSACNALGESLRARFDLRHDVSDARQAIEAYRAAGTQATGTAHERATAAWRWGETEAILGSYDAALTGYETAVSLLDLVAWRGLNAEDRERLLIDFGDLARDVAACAVAAGRPDRAVELLEQGRGVLLSQALDARSGYDLLREQVPELADRLALLSDRLDSTANLDGGLDQRMAFAREREALLTQIREQPGHADFLRPPSLADIRPGPQDGPVVIVNVARLRSDALIVTADDLRVVELSGDLVDQVAQQVSTLLAITADFDNHDRKATGDSLTDILAWLFHTIGQPVLAVLPPAEPPRRVWWCPTGQLSLLPLHAAGSPSGSVLDSVISSYTPTLRILKRARQASPPDVNAGLLTVVPDAQPPLPAGRRATPTDNPPNDITQQLPTT